MPLGATLLLDACRSTVRWRAVHGDLCVAVNVSTRQLIHGGFVDTVLDSLSTSGLPPEALCLELTESHLLEAASSAKDALSRLGDEGIHISLDDFGTGYSSLSYLTRLPVDKLKIDKEFIDGLTHDGHDTTVVHAVISLAQALGLLTVAEGVETEGQASILADLGCSQAQGYLFSRPVAAPLVDELLEQSPSV